MHNHKKMKLKERGWSDQEIINAEKILEKEKEYDAHFSRIVFWSALIVIIFSNMLVSLGLIPFLIVLNSWVLYLIIILLAGCIGFLYNLLITDIGHLKKKHHISAGIIIPLIAIANLIGMVLVSNKFIRDLQIKNVQHNPWTIAILFAIVLITPYIIGRIKFHFKEKNQGKVINLTS